MSWQTVKLGDVMTVGRGSSPRPIKDERFFTGGTIPWVKIADATASGKFIYQTNQHVNDYGASFSRKLKPGALIFPASGTLGIPRFLGVEACIHDGWLYFSDYQGIDPDWLYYRIILLKNYYEGIAYGAAIQNINTDIVRNTEIQLPDLATQRAMTAVLGTYDDLIATNQRRIALLEDAARRLYREWFVHLRFPGHESVPVKDGVPEGWAMSTVDAFGGIETGKTPVTANSAYFGGDIPFIKTPDMHGKMITNSSEQTLSTLGSDS
ncbi:MAG: restriction endonuclease subunit S, partial [Burkholderiales bacterium]|nr:restriction endonuclease subunit S [Burkholderiales bacterium]